jgi:hypothetical protein
MLSGGQNWSDPGNLEASHFITVTATGMTGPTTATFVGTGLASMQRQVVLVNAMQTPVSFGRVVNSHGLAISSQRQ